MLFCATILLPLFLYFVPLRSGNKSETCEDIKTLISTTLYKVYYTFCRELDITRKGPTFRARKGDNMAHTCQFDFISFYR